MVGAGCLLLSTYLAGHELVPGIATRPVEEIVVKGQALEAIDAPYSTTTFGTDAIRRLNIATVQQLFEDVPGMSVRDFGLPGVADSITIRGFGNGGHGGDLGVVVDGIPLNEAMSHADGYVDLNVIIPLEVERITVFKGPVSALYGNYNRGGLVRIDTRKSGDYIEFDLGIGSDGLTDLQAAYGVGAGDQQLNLAVQHVHSDGYRPRTGTERNSFSGRWNIGLTERSELALSARWHRADSDSASYLTGFQYRRDADGIDPRVQGDGADKAFATLRADLNHDLSESVRLLSFVYATRQDFSRWFSRPVAAGQWRQREESYERSVDGAGISLNGRAAVNDRTISWVAGIEAFRESTDFIYFDGLDRRRRISAAIDDRETQLNSVSGFVEAQMEWHRLLMPSVGLRYDRFSGDCRRRGPETGANPCDILSDLDNISPKIGLRSALHRLELRASWSEGFALPNGWTKYRRSAANLEPVTFRQIEVGLAWQPSEHLALDVATYELVSSDEQRTLAPGTFENYGATDRRGVEASLDWLPRETLSLSLVYGLTDSEVVKNADPALLGNEVGGVSDYSATASAQWQFAPSWALDLRWRAVGGYALSADNSAYADSYDLVDLGVSYSVPGPYLWKLYARIDNLTDKRHAPTELIIGGDHLYAPGPPRRFRVGIQISL